MNPVVIMIGILIAECALRVYEPVLKSIIPVLIDILCKSDADHLFSFAADHITELRIRPGCCVEPRFFRCIGIHVISMKANIPSRLHVARKNKIVSCIANIAQKNIVPWYWKPFCEIIKRRIHFSQSARIHKTEADCYGIFKPGAML